MKFAYELVEVNEGTEVWIDGEHINTVDMDIVDIVDILETVWLLENNEIN